MSQFEIELLKTAWPLIWLILSCALPAGALYFVRQQSARMTALAASVEAMAEKFEKLDKQIAEDRAASRARLLKLDGEISSRLAVLETQNSMQHPDAQPRRRATDQPSRWFADSDIGVKKGV